VLNATGWSFVDEGGPGKRKWGYISSRPDSLLTIKVRNRLLLSCKPPHTNRHSSKFCERAVACGSSHHLRWHELRQLNVFSTRDRKQVSTTATCTMQHTPSDGLIVPNSSLLHKIP
jgi:hypothetical protein